VSNVVVILDILEPPQIVWNTIEAVDIDTADVLGLIAQAIRTLPEMPWSDKSGPGIPFKQINFVKGLSVRFHIK